jgi:hypothetical protein
MIKDLIISVSLANLCYSSIWAKIYYGELIGYTLAIVAAVCNITIIATIIFICITLAKNDKHLLLSFMAQCLLVVPFIILIGNIIIIIPKYYIYFIVKIFGRAFILIPAILIGLLVTSLFIKYHKKIYKVIAIVSLLALPLLAINYVHSVVSLATSLYTAAPHNTLDNNPIKQKIYRHQTPRATRILILVFDEMDYRAVFEDRPAGLNLPDLDRFRHEAVFATHAFPPAKFTRLSFPAMTTGKLVSDSKINSEGQRLVLRESQKSVMWQDQENIFSMSHARGLNNAILGAFLPYLQTFGLYLAFGRQFQDYDRTTSLPESMSEQFRDLAVTLPLGGHLGLANRMYLPMELSKQIRRYQKFLVDIKSAAVNPDLDLIFVHLPVPHVPFIYDHLTDNFSLKNGDYYDNMALVNRTLREVRQAMEVAGLWDQSHILITSDHWWRSQTFFVTRADHRVPFLLKLAGQKTEVTYDRPFNTVLL